MEGLQALKEEGIIRHLGLTNFDTDHLHLLLQEGIPIISNQVVVSLLDRRALAEMSRLCLEHGVKLLAYGTVAGGFLSERWLGQEEPSLSGIHDWSKMKYKRFIDQQAAGRNFSKSSGFWMRLPGKMKSPSPMWPPAGFWINLRWER